jgi:hypothetical protein
MLANQSNAELLELLNNFCDQFLCVILQPINQLLDPTIHEIPCFLIFLLCDVIVVVVTPLPEAVRISTISHGA